MTSLQVPRLSGRGNICQIPLPQGGEGGGGPSIPRIKRENKTKNGDLRGSKPLPQFPSKDSVENVAKVHTQCCSRCLRGSFQQPGKGRFFNWAVRFLISCQKLNLLVQWTPLIKPKKPPSFRNRTSSRQVNSSKPPRLPSNRHGSRKVRSGSWGCKGDAANPLLQVSLQLC